MRIQNGGTEVVEAKAGTVSYPSSEALSVYKIGYRNGLVSTMISLNPLLCPSSLTLYYNVTNSSSIKSP